VTPFDVSALAPVTLWRCSCDSEERPAWLMEPLDDIDVWLDAKYSAIPASQFAALLASHAAIVELLGEARDACIVAYQHLDRFGVVSGGHENERASQDKAFAALRPIVSKSGATRARIDAAIGGAK
jgi:hypothetical protein